MAYTCAIAPGQSIYLDEQDAHTIVTLTSSSAGQQQQSTSRYPTGPWTAPPTVVQTSGGTVITVFTNNGNTHIQVQGNAIALTQQTIDLSQAQPMPMQQVASPPGTSAHASPLPSISPLSMTPMPSMSPMPSMTPMDMGNMTMGNMSMQMQPMEMRMGNMAMSMGNQPTASDSNHEAQGSESQSVTPKPVTPKFCSQCGAGVQKGDRFCSQCGHQL